MSEQPDIAALMADLRTTAERGYACPKKPILAILDNVDALTRRAETAEKERDELRDAAAKAQAGWDHVRDTYWAVVAESGCKTMGELQGKAARADAAEARVRELEEALQPFAERLPFNHDRYDGRNTFDIEPEIDDLRRAARLLADAKERAP